MRLKWENEAFAQGINLNVLRELNSLPPVLGNSAELREVLSNIVINSIEAMPHGGRIIINTSLDNNYVIVSVSDTGTGMSEEIKSNAVYTVVETQKLLKISESTIKRMLKKGLIKVNKVGGQYRILGKEILRLVLPEVEQKAIKSYLDLKQKVVDKINKW